MTCSPRFIRGNIGINVLIRLLLLSVLSLALNYRVMDYCRVEPDPRGGEHEVNMLAVSVPPKFEYTFEVELADHLVSCDQSVHVSFQSQFSVHTLLVKLYFNE